MKGVDACGCFPTGRHYPGIAHLIRVRAIGVAQEVEAEAVWIESAIAFIDTETTGRDPNRDRIIEVGIVLARGGEIIRRVSWLIDPEMPIPEESAAVHGIRDDDVRGKPLFKDVLAEIMAVLVDAIPAAYNAEFDRAFMRAELGRVERPPSVLSPAFRREVEWLDPLVFAREIYKEEQSRALGEMAQRLGIALERAHRATDDAEAALQVLFALAKDPRLPRGYAALLQEQRRLSRQFEEARRFWRKPN